MTMIPPISTAAIDTSPTSWRRVHRPPTSHSPPSYRPSTGLHQRIPDPHPVPRQAALRHGEGEASVADQPVRPVLDLVLLGRVGIRLRPEVGHGVRPSEFERNQVIDLATDRPRLEHRPGGRSGRLARGAHRAVEPIDRVLDHVGDVAHAGLRRVSGRTDPLHRSTSVHRARGDAQVVDELGVVVAVGGQWGGGAGGVGRRRSWRALGDWLLNEVGLTVGLGTTGKMPVRNCQPDPISYATISDFP